MSITVDDVSRLEEYLKGVMDRAGHHASNVNEVVMTLMGAVLWRKDTTPLEVRTQAGETANIIWFEVDGRKYALAYNHKAKLIELRERTLRGNVLHSFDNRTTAAQVRTIFSAL